VLVAVMAYFVLHDFPETATFLTEEERAFVVYRLKYQDFMEEREEGAVRVAQDDSFQWRFVKDAFLDWQIWTNVWVYWGTWSFSSAPAIANKNRHRLSPLRDLAIPPVDYQRPWIYQLNRATLDGADLYNRLNPCGHGRMVQRSCRKAVSVHPRVFVSHGGWLHHVRCELDTWSHLRWGVHRSVRLVSCFPW
jgi:hypothetical protein